MTHLFLAIWLLVVMQTSAHALDVGTAWTAVPVADVTVTSTATLVKAANSARTALSCTNTSGSVNVRWGDSTVTAAQGQRIPFGTSVEIRNTAAIYMISEGADVTISCTEERR